METYQASRYCTLRTTKLSSLANLASAFNLRVYFGEVRGNWRRKLFSYFVLLLFQMVVALIGLKKLQIFMTLTHHCRGYLMF